jgi:hypothetical protein
MSTHRKIPAIMTNTPPPKMLISEILVFIGNDARHSIGMGIDIRYRSVITFSTTVTYKSILEMAGWQKSN